MVVIKIYILLIISDGSVYNGRLWFILGDSGLLWLALAHSAILGSG